MEVPIGRSIVRTKEQTELMGAREVVNPIPADRPFVAVKQDDGRWTIQNVSVFLEHERAGYTFDSGWCRNAIQQNQRRLSEGYKPPLHLGHHGETATEPESAGFFRLTDLAPATYEGHQVNVLYADFVDVPDEIYQEIVKEKLPFRSVEIHDPSVSEIDSIALMGSVVPYFKLRNLVPDVEISETEELRLVAQARSSKCPVLAYGAERNHAEHLHVAVDCGGLRMTKPAATPQTRRAGTKERNAFQRYLAARRQQRRLLSDKASGSNKRLKFKKDDKKDASPDSLVASAKTEAASALYKVQEIAEKVAEAIEQVAASMGLDLNMTVETEGEDLGDDMGMDLPPLDDLEMSDNGAGMPQGMAGLDGYGGGLTKALKRIKSLGDALGKNKEYGTDMGSEMGAEDDTDEMAYGQYECEACQDQGCPACQNQTTGGPVEMSARSANGKPVRKPVRKPTTRPRKAQPATRYANKPKGSQPEVMRYARLAGRLRAVEGQLAQKENEQKLEQYLAAKVATLQRYNASPEVIEDLRELAKGGGRAAVEAYVKGVQTHGTPNDTLLFHNEGSSGAASGDSPAEPAAIAKYAAKGPQLHAAARKAYMEYKSGTPSLQREFTAEQYVEAQMFFADQLYGEVFKG